MFLQVILLILAALHEIDSILPSNFKSMVEINLETDPKIAAGDSNTNVNVNPHVFLKISDDPKVAVGHSTINEKSNPYVLLELHDDPKITSVDSNPNDMVNQHVLLKLSKSNMYGKKATIDAQEHILLADPKIATADSNTNEKVNPYALLKISNYNADGDIGTGNVPKPNVILDTQEINSLTDPKTSIESSDTSLLSSSLLSSCPNFVIGDGVGGSEKFLGFVSSVNECLAMVRAAPPLQGSLPNGMTFFHEILQMNMTVFHVSCYAEYGMQRSNGHSSWRTCLLVPLPTCPNLVFGDGSGGTERYLGRTYSILECMKLARTNAPTANGVTIGKHDSSGYASCYAEFRMNGISSSTFWRTCRLPNIPICPSSVAGDGSGGVERNVGSATSVLNCMRAVRRSYPAANGITFTPSVKNNSSGSCYAEFRMNGKYSSSYWNTCSLPNIVSYPNFMPGDGYGGSENYVGNVSSISACKSLVISTYSSRSEVPNGITFSKHVRQGQSGSCYAEFGMTTFSTSNYWYTCKI
jgi:hypothetical protein